MKFSKKSPDASAPKKERPAKGKKDKQPRGGKKVVGVELDSRYIRTVEFDAGSTKSFSKFHEEPLDQGVIISGVVQNPAALTEALVKVWKEQKYSSKEVQIALNSENSLAEPTTMDDEQDFAQVLPFRIPVGTFDPEEYHLGFHNLKMYDQDERDTSRVEGYRTVSKRDIFLVGMRREEVSRITDAFKKAKLFPVSLDIAALAIMRANPTKTMEGSVDVHVNISSDATLIVVSHTQQPVYIRNIDHQGDNLITRQIIDAMDIDPVYARELQEKAATMSVADVMRSQSDEEESVFGGEDEEAPVRFSEDQLAAYNIVQTEIGEIIRTIETTVTYFSNSNNLGLGDRFGKFILSGDTTVMESVRQRISGESNVEVVMSTPLDTFRENGYTFSDETVNNIKQERFAVALGAAVGTGKVQD